MTTPAAPSIMELEVRTAVCVVPGCGGAVVRHALGSAQAVDRCLRCFRRYQVSGKNEPATPSRLRRIFNEFVSWRD